MRPWLRPIFEHLVIGLVPVDGDFGRREPSAEENEACLEVQPIPPAPRPQADETAWIPRAILYGPPL